MQKTFIKRRTYLVFLIFILLSGCSETKVKDYGEASTIEELMDIYPHLKSTYYEIPSELQLKIIVPSLSDIPFEIKEIELDYSNNDTGILPGITVLFSGDDKRITSAVWKSKFEEISTAGETIELQEGITGYYYDRVNEIAIHWRDPDEESQLLYGVGLLTIDFDTFTKKKNEFTKEDAIKIANSVIDNYSLNKE